MHVCGMDCDGLTAGAEAVRPNSESVAPGLIRWETCAAALSLSATAQPHPTPLVLRGERGDRTRGSAQIYEAKNSACVLGGSRGESRGGAYLPAGLAFELDVKEPPVELCKHKHPTDRGSQRAAVGTGHSIRTEGTCCSFQAPLWWTMQMTRNGGGDIIARWRHYSACCG